MKTTYSILFFLFLSFTLLAQENSEKQKAEINKIKKSKNYIYGEATLEDKDEALQLAKELLVKHIDEWVASEKKMKSSEVVVVRDIIENSESINLMRGNMYRAFVYAQKKNILPVEDTDTSVILSRSTDNEHESALVVNDIAKVDLVKQNSEETAQYRADDTSQNILTSILTITKWEDVGPYFQDLKAKRKIVYGKYNAKIAADSCYLLIYNRDGDVAAVLDKGHQVNLKSLEEDNIKNYSGHGAIWFQLF